MQGYHRDEAGIQHFCLPALLETPPEVEGCHGVVTLGDEGLTLQGFGAMESVTGLYKAQVPAGA